MSNSQKDPKTDNDSNNLFKVVQAAASVEKVSPQEKEQNSKGMLDGEGNFVKLNE